MHVKSQGGVSSLSVAIFLRWKYLHKNRFESPTQVVNEFTFEFKNYDLALSSDEDGKIYKHIASFAPMPINFEYITFSGVLWLLLHHVGIL